VQGGFREGVGAYLAGIELGSTTMAAVVTTWEWSAMVVVERKGVWHGQQGMVVNAHIPQHEGRGMTQPGGWVMQWQLWLRLRVVGTRKVRSSHR